MKAEILRLIKQYNSIIIARHKNPDLDAYGSQFGLYYSLKEKYPEKAIYAVGDTNSLNSFGEFDDVNQETYSKSLVIILDTVSKALIDPNVYKNYAKLVFIDHHNNEAEIPNDIAYQVMDSASCAEIVTELLLDWDFPINKKAARALYMGIIGDTGRFFFPSTTASTLRIASILIEKGVDIAEVHDRMYTETKRTKQIKNDFFNLVRYTDNNLAYSLNGYDFIDKYGLTSFFVSRGLVNQMAGMEEVKIWVNFTVDTETDKILCEIRSRALPVLHVAKKYCGGGHLRACGCTLDSWEDTKLVIKDLDKILEENNG